MVIKRVNVVISRCCFAKDGTDFFLNKSVPHVQHDYFPTTWSIKFLIYSALRCSLVFFQFFFAKYVPQRRASLPWLCMVVVFGFDWNLFRFCCFLLFFFAVLGFITYSKAPLYKQEQYMTIRAILGYLDGAQMFSKTKLTCLGYQGGMGWPENTNPRSTDLVCGPRWQTTKKNYQRNQNIIIKTVGATTEFRATQITITAFVIQWYGNEWPCIL